MARVTISQLDDSLTARPDPVEAEQGEELVFNIGSLDVDVIPPANILSAGPTKKGGKVTCRIDCKASIAVHKYVIISNSIDDPINAPRIRIKKRDPATGDAPTKVEVAIYKDTFGNFVGDYDFIYVARGERFSIDRRGFNVKFDFDDDLVDHCKTTTNGDVDTFEVGLYAKLGDNTCRLLAGKGDPIDAPRIRVKVRDKLTGNSDD